MGESPKISVFKFKIRVFKPLGFGVIKPHHRRKMYFQKGCGFINPTITMSCCMIVIQEQKSSPQVGNFWDFGILNPL